jgi:uncharacterized protein (DUF1800 family)
MASRTTKITEIRTDVITSYHMNIGKKKEVEILFLAIRILKNKMSSFVHSDLETLFLAIDDKEIMKELLAKYKLFESSFVQAWELQSRLRLNNKAWQSKLPSFSISTRMRKYIFTALFCMPLLTQAASINDTNKSELFFLNRITYGLNADGLAQFKKNGYDGYLKNQLVFHGDDGLPVSVRQQIAAMDISKIDGAGLLTIRHLMEQKLKDANTSDERNKIQQDINKRDQFIMQQAAERRVLRAIYSTNQLQEMLTWFWFNHFNVFQYKGSNSLLLADYEEHAIRPHVLGKFRDLLLATLTHPAMLIYLDNAQNSVGAVNENYAREIMELHTMGVGSGYAQADVENLARILTGVGVDLAGNGCLVGTSQLANVTASSSLFCFNPKRHDQHTKLFLGQNFPAGGNADDVVHAVDMLAQQPATAHFIAHQLALYFLDDNPPASVVDKMAHTFSKTDGDIAKTLNTLFHSVEFSSGQYFGSKYKDPVQYVLSSMRLLYGGEPIQDVRPVVNWINQLGEPLYTHLTPEGYGMCKQDSLSADQMTKRFEIARAMLLNAGTLYTNEQLAISLDATDKKQLQTVRNEARIAHPVDTFGIYDLMRPLLSSQTLQILRQTLTMDEWNSLLLSSPEFMYR